ncbi:MAG: hypothetical protein J6Y48_13845 [Clostridia bacterium]|nr:hypothetical protein [Clostridia bacterium]
MSDRNDKQFVQHSIDTGLADLQGNPFLAQRIMNQERTEQPVMKKKISFAFILAIILLLACAATAAAGTFNEDFNAWLYRIWPEAAKTLMPVNMSCTEGGIRMEVISAVNEGSEVYVTYSLQDLEEDRITPDTQAVMDAQSGSISTSFSHTAEPLYQPDDKTMVFGQRIRLDNGLQEHQTLQFSIDSLSPVRTEYMDLLPLYKQYASEVKTMPVPENAEALRNGTPDEIRRSGVTGISDPASLSEEDLAFLCYANGQAAEIPEGMRVLDNHSGLEIPLAKDAALSGIGMVDGLLHVQIHVNPFVQQVEPISLGHYTEYHILMHDAESSEFFTSMSRYIALDKLPNGIHEIRWKERLESGKEDYWRELIFAVDGEPTEAQKLQVELHTYDGVIRGPWQAEIPVRLIQKK